MQILRGYSTRAQITSTGFINEYSFGNFKGDEEAWMAKYFDAFLYVANWGTRVLMLRLPATLLPERAARAYGEANSRDHEVGLTLRAQDEKVILRFGSMNEEGGGEWIEESELLESLVPIRSELAHGDLRALYLAWLRGIQNGDHEASDPEPPVPPGLQSLSPALTSLVEFLEIDPDLLAVASEASAAARAVTQDPKDRARWIAGLPSAEKDELLRRLMDGDASQVAIELSSRYERRKAAEPSDPLPGTRTVGQLLSAAEGIRKRRDEATGKRAAEEKARRDRAEAQAREKHLEAVARRMPEFWDQVETLVATKQKKAYAAAVQILRDLSEVSTRRGAGSDFTRRLAAFRARHAQKRTLLDQLSAERWR